MTDEIRLNELRAKVAAHMSESRYLHTLSVEAEIVSLGKRYLPGKLCALRAAALLHDLTKALPTDEQLRLAEQGSIPLPQGAHSSPAVLHSLTAEVVIRRELAPFATEEILTAISRHTIGHPDMSTFDKLLFLADFIEPTRKAESCRAVRKELYGALAEAKSREDEMLALDRAVFRAVSATISYLKSANLPILPESYEVYKAFSRHLSE